MSGVGPALAQTGDDSPSTAPGRVDADVVAALADQGSTDVWVVFDEQPDLTAAAAIDDWADRGAAVVDALRDQAQRSQAEIVELLEERHDDFTPYWISNRVLVRDASTSLTNAMAVLQGVDEVTLTGHLDLPDQTFETAEQAGRDDVEWGLSSIKADEAWSEYDVLGEDIVVGSVDSGVQYDHPALVEAYRGNLGDGGFDHDYNWFDPTGDCDGISVEPCDRSGHGTHVTGTMVGDDGPGNRIGVAPGARWIAARGCEGGGCSDASLLAAGQFMLAPTNTAGENPRPDLRPHIVNNSWGMANGSAINPWYDHIVSAWTASGIFAVFSNGNYGPGCDSAGSPGDSVHSYSVGSYGADNQIAASSSRGPGANGDIRPHIAAPGVNVRSARPGDAYGLSSGTSMAAPHVSGSVALLWSAVPNLVGDITGTRALLDGSAIDVDDTSCGGTAEDNNVWGEGRLDVLALIAAAPRGETGVLAGAVVDDSGAPVAGAEITVAGPQQREIGAGDDGTFSVLLVVGDYTVAASAFGFYPTEVETSVASGESTTVELALGAIPTHSVTGRVVDSAGAGLPGATVTIGDGVLPSVSTDAHGDYRVEAVPEGTYRVTATADGCLGPLDRELSVEGGAARLDLELPDVTDEYGHTCRVGSEEFLSGNTDLGLTGDDGVTTIDLPFPVGFYGQTYQQAHVSANGYLSFDASTSVYDNTAIPDPDHPNAAVYPFWDDLTPTDGGRVYTGLHGEAGDRVLVIEWRGLRMIESDQLVTVSVGFHEDGDLVFGYGEVPADSERAQGSSATIGLENADGTDALLFSYDTPVLSSGRSIRFTSPVGADGTRLRTS
ncbi:S8 family serine peptidase [Actinoalloteichus hymeniacidonis]|uniref:S8 family serine peptidase n=1 Tax=Actinoalloteichus hymeniacidonis TaxID=340345 RepID=UPI0012F92D70|nr:S8 family serine peptidase [Actinoalloteichus hymeniacidonis]MBB5909031.1 subtilisin family serine protease [Actinoalloteichus hymeniacidonis]